MRSVYHILQKLRDQEKRTRQIAFAEAEAVRMACETQLNNLNSAFQASQLQPETESASETNWSEYLLRQRYFEVLGGESELHAAEEESNKRREDLLEAQKESQIMEELIQNMQDKERQQQKQKEGKVNDELGSMAWWRNK